MENLLEKDYKMSKKYLFYILTFIVSISILGIFSYSFRYQWFINSIVDQKYKIGLNRDIKGFAAEYPYIYTYGDYGVNVNIRMYNFDDVQCTVIPSVAYGFVTGMNLQLC